jgi:hypothetical protein
MIMRSSKSMLLLSNFCEIINYSKLTSKITEISQNGRDKSAQSIYFSRQDCHQFIYISLDWHNTSSSSHATLHSPTYLKFLGSKRPSQLVSKLFVPTRNEYIDNHAEFVTRGEIAFAKIMSSLRIKYFSEKNTKQREQLYYIKGFQDPPLETARTQLWGATSDMKRNDCAFGYPCANPEFIHQAVYRWDIKSGDVQAK